jgi:hypothetical protein
MSSIKYELEYIVCLWIDLLKVLTWRFEVLILANVNFLLVRLLHEIAITCTVIHSTTVLVRAFDKYKGDD